MCKYASACFKPAISEIPTEAIFVFYDDSCSIHLEHSIFLFVDKPLDLCYNKFLCVHGDLAELLLFHALNAMFTFRDVTLCVALLYIDQNHRLNPVKRQQMW